MVSRKIFSGLRSLWHFHDVLPEWTRFRLVNSLLLPILYSDIGIFEYYAGSIRDLEKAVNACKRFAYKIGRHHDRLCEWGMPFWDAHYIRF